MPRAMWSGAISFGLVNIPVKLYKATASTSGNQVSFHQIHKTCGTRLRHIRWCPKDEVEVPWDEVAECVPAYGKYVEARIAQFGRDHPFIRSEYFLEEIDSEGRLFGPERRAQMRGDHPRQHAAAPGRQYALLVDVAGADESAA